MVFTHTDFADKVNHTKKNLKGFKIFSIMNKTSELVSQYLKTLVSTVASTTSDSYAAIVIKNFLGKNTKRSPIFSAVDMDSIATGGDIKVSSSADSAPAQDITAFFEIINQELLNNALRQLVARKLDQAVAQQLKEKGAAL